MSGGESGLSRAPGGPNRAGIGFAPIFYGYDPAAGVNSVLSMQTNVLGGLLRNAALRLETRR